MGSHSGYELHARQHLGETSRSEWESTDLAKEDKIYEEPADESRAPELWTNSSQWLRVEKLMSIHTDVVKELRNHLFDLTDDDSEENGWLMASPDDFQRLNNLIQEDLVKPTANLADLVGS